MITPLAMLAVVLQTDPGLTWQGLIEDLPTDPASMFVLVLVGASIFLIWRGSRPKKRT